MSKKLKNEIQRDIDGFTLADCYADEIYKHDKNTGRYHFYPLGKHISDRTYTVFLYSGESCIKVVPLRGLLPQQLDVRGLDFDRLEFDTAADPDGHIHVFAYPANYCDRFDPVDPTPVEVPVDDAPETMEQMIARMVGERIAMERAADQEHETFDEANDFGDDDDDDDDHRGLGYITDYTELEDDDLSDLVSDPPTDAEQPDPARDPAAGGPAAEPTNAPASNEATEPKSGPDASPPPADHHADPHAGPQAASGGSR